jgi:hypothetical protein
MGKYRVSFRKDGQGVADRREYGIIVDANTLGSAEEQALREISETHGKAFLSAREIIKIEQIA